jgi:hypothetical protein
LKTDPRKKNETTKIKQFPFEIDGLNGLSRLPIKEAFSQHCCFTPNFAAVHSARIFADIYEAGFTGSDGDAWYFL